MTNDSTDPDDDYDDGPMVQQGIVFVLVERGHNLMSANSGGKTDPYCVLWLGDVKKQTEAKKDICDPVWNENFDWPNISCTDTLYLEVGFLSEYLLLTFNNRFAVCKVYSIKWGVSHRYMTREQ